MRNIKLDPSGFYRIGQYLEYLNGNFVIHNLSTENEFKKNLRIKKPFLKKLYQGFLYLRMMRKVTFFILYDYFAKVDAIFIQRTILPRYLPIFLLSCLKYISKNKSIIWDFDDNIIESGEISAREKNLLAEKSEKIIVTSSYLKATLPKDSLDKVILLPTTDINLSLIYKDSIIAERETTYRREINIIWIGTDGNLKFLAEIIDHLDDAALQLNINNSKQLNLYVICNLPLTIKTKNLNIINISWLREIVPEYIKKAHIGIMPLQDNYYTKGKAGFKLVQYMATGLPVIGSAVGYNIAVVDNNSGLLVSSNNISKWKDCLIKMCIDIDFWKSLSFGARTKFMNDFNPQKNVGILNSCIS
ncbi:glycosyltransferase [Treponema socranskii]|uniref:glycosyltransferase n=1 Tax=Treponema socranskii TaxID=53419 RepID=UPI003D8F0137